MSMIVCHVGHVVGVGDLLQPVSHAASKAGRGRAINTKEFHKSERESNVGLVEAESTTTSKPNKPDNHLV